MSPKSPSFDPDTLFANWSAKPTPPSTSLPFASAIRSTFSLPEKDTYIYHAAPTSLSLSQAQSAVNAGRANNLHAWYRDAQSGEPLTPPPQPDIEAYIKYFDPKTSTPDKALKALIANAKKGSLREGVGKRLQQLRVVPEEVKIARNKGFLNPGLEFWAWSCKELEWSGPVKEEREGSGEVEESEDGEGKKVGGALRVKLSPQSHHVLPIFMHHFGCVIPTYESLLFLSHIATPANRPIYDVGSGNGYWTCILRRHGLTVTPVDNAQSEWRTLWINDTVKEDGATFLKKKGGGKDGVLLMVYPVTADGFVEKTVGAYMGDTVVIAGTMNGNGYTGFKDRKVGEWMLERGWKLWGRVPLPSFGGKDEGMEVFVRGTQDASAA